MNEMPYLLDVNGVASALKISPHTVRRWVAEEKLPIVKLGTRVLFEPKSIQSFIEGAKKGKL